MSFVTRDPWITWKQMFPLTFGQTDNVEDTIETGRYSLDDLNEMALLWRDGFSRRREDLRPAGCR